LGFPASSSYNFTSVAHNQRFSVTIIDAHNMQQAMPFKYIELFSFKFTQLLQEFRAHNSVYNILTVQAPTNSLLLIY